MKVDIKSKGQDLLLKNYLIYIYHCMQTTARRYRVYKCQTIYCVLSYLHFNVVQLSS